ncbi:MAG: ATPase [Bacteroidota bacterium]
MKHLILLLLNLVFCVTLQAEVIGASAHGFHVQSTLLIEASPLEVYDALTRQIGQWWDADHSYSGEGSNFYLEARANGCFCELLPNGGSVLHMLVAHANPGKTLRLLGGLGPLQEMGIHGAMTFSFSETETGTELTLTYIVSGYVKEGLTGLAPVVDQVLAGQVGRLKNFVEK